VILRANDHSIETYLPVHIYWLQLNIFRMHLFLVIIITIIVIVIVIFILDITINFLMKLVTTSVTAHY